METNMHINDLPLEILGKVMSFLNFYHRNTAMLVCKKWYEVLQHPAYLQKTIIKLDDISLLQDIPHSLGQRKVPNIRIVLGEDVNRPPIFHELARLLPHIRYVHLAGTLYAADISLCVQQFPHVEAVKIEPNTVESITHVFDNRKIKRKFSDMMGSLEEATFVIPFWHGGKDLIELLNCLSGVSKVSLKWKAPPPGEIINRESPITGHHLVQLLARTELAKHLQDLDLRCFYMSPESFSVFLRMPSLNLRSLDFISDDGCRHIDILAKSDLNLESLHVVLEGPGSFNVQYPVVNALLLAKPSLRSITVSGILYNRDREMGTVFEEWPNASRVLIPDVSEDIAIFPDILESTLLCFWQRAGKNNLVVRSMFMDFGRKALLKLAKYSPGLEELTTQGSIDVPDPISLSMIADSFPDLRELSVSLTNLSNVDLGIPRVPDGGSDKFAKLKDLYLGYCKSLTDADVVNLCLPSLKRLWLSKSPGVTDDGVCSVVSNNTGLQLLGLGGCSNVTDRSIEAIATHLRYLRALLLSKCHLVNADAARMLAEGCCMLEFIDVHGCGDEFINAVEGLRRSMRYLCDMVVSEESCGVPFMKSEWYFATDSDRSNEFLTYDDTSLWV